jgi:hypothetical protein
MSPSFGTAPLVDHLAFLSKTGPNKAKKLTPHPLLLTGFPRISKALVMFVK